MKGIRGCHVSEMLHASNLAKEKKNIESWIQTAGKKLRFANGFERSHLEIS